MRDRRWALVILAAGLVVAVVSGVVAYRIGGPHGGEEQGDRRVRRVFNEETGAIETVMYDLDGDLRFDRWSYLDGERAIRTEYDLDADGRFDHWEYLRADGTTERVDADTDGDGQPDWRIRFDGSGMVSSNAPIAPVEETHTR